MLFPFRDIEDKNVKSASYGAPMAGAHILWQPSGNTLTKNKLTLHSNCLLPANSISFVEIEPTFRLPKYIAIRFNLSITHVHRGLLLGTGPLVDPGFWGRILIPIHNLTDSDYTIPAGKNLVWVEFTKTTYGRKSNSSSDKTPRLAQSVAFPERKQQKPPEWYLNNAGHGEPICSSIPNAVVVSRTAAEQAAASAAAIRDRVTFAGIIGAMALGATALGIYVQTHSLVQDAHNLSQTAVGMIGTATTEIKQQTEEAKQLTEKIQNLDAKLNALQREFQLFRDAAK